MDNSKQRIIAIAAVGIVLLLGINAFLLVKNSKQSAKNQELVQQLDETEQLQQKLQEEYDIALNSLEEQKGTNEELNTLIEEQKVQLEEQKNRISRLLRDSKQLSKARSDMQAMSAQNEQFLVEINQLKQENAGLRVEKEQLTERTVVLSSSLDEKTQEAEELSEDKAALTAEKESLQTERAALSEKVGIASVIRVNTVDVKGFKTRGNGKTVEKKSAKNIDHLKICFNTTENRVTQLGDEMFYVRIINPVGETLAVEELGSGVVTDRDTGEQIRFTKTLETEYDRSANTLCTKWQPNVPFQEGNYEVQVYNKGFIAGKGSFSLK